MLDAISVTMSATDTARSRVLSGEDGGVYVGV